MVRLGKVVYRDHIIKEKELNLEGETKLLRDSKGDSPCRWLSACRPQVDGVCRKRDPNPEQKWEDLHSNSLLL